MKYGYECLYDDLEWRGILGNELRKRITEDAISSLFTMPQDVKKNNLDFMYGHSLHGGLEMLQQFVVSWLCGGSERFCISHDLNARRGDPFLDSLPSKFQRSNVFYHADEVYYIFRIYQMSAIESLSFFLRMGIPKMLMCMGDNIDATVFSQKDLSCETMERVVRNSTYMVRGICDDEGFALIPLCEVEKKSP